MKVSSGLLFVSLSAAVACGSHDVGDKPSASAAFVIPSDAQNVVHDRIGPSDQVLFTVQRKYPAFAFNQDTLEKLNREGWKQCHSPSEAWTSFADASTGVRTTVHQRIIHFRRGHQVLMLVGRYKSPSAAGSAAQVPDSDQQVGNVSLVSGTSSDIETALKVFNAQC